MGRKDAGGVRILSLTFIVASCTLAAAFAVYLNLKGKKNQQCVVLYITCAASHAIVGACELGGTVQCNNTMFIGLTVYGAEATHFHMCTAYLAISFSEGFIGIEKSSPCDPELGQCDEPLYHPTLLKTGISPSYPYLTTFRDRPLFGRQI